MCRFCDHIQDEIQRLKDKMKTMECKRLRKTPIKHPERRRYFQKYYQENRERKLAEANERHRRLRESNEQRHG